MKYNDTDIIASWIYVLYVKNNYIYTTLYLFTGYVRY